MRIASIALLLSVCFGLPGAVASEKVVIPAGAAPQLDGRVQEEEWLDAASIRLSIENEITVQVRMKHDGRNLYCAFSFTNNPGRALVFPELLIDPDHDRSPQWAPDDWWFHVSGTDCEARGTFSDYSNCKADQLDWKGIPNYELSETPPPVEGIEMTISLEKIGISVDRVFGLSLTVELVPDKRAFWPEAAVMESPSTWGTAVLKADP